MLEVIVVTNITSITSLEFTSLAKGKTRLAFSWGLIELIVMAILFQSANLPVILIKIA